MLNQKIKFQIPVLVVVFSLLLVASCAPPVETAYQKQVGVPSAKWTYGFQPEFTFEIPDTTSQYNLFLIFRYDAAFEFSNIWLRLHSKAPGDTAFTEGKRIETVLIAHDGSRLGNNVGGMFEYKVQLAPEDFEPFKKTGLYTIKLEQVMRKDPLVGLVNIGLRVERYNVKDPVR